MSKLLVAIAGASLGYAGFKVMPFITVSILVILSSVILGMFLVRVKLAPQFIMDKLSEQETEAPAEVIQVEEKSIEARQLEVEQEERSVRDEQIKAQSRKELLAEQETEKQEKFEKEFLETHGISCHEHNLEHKRSVEKIISGPSIIDKVDQHISDEFDKFHDPDAEAQEDTDENETEGVDEVDSDMVSDLDDMMPDDSEYDDEDDFMPNDPTVLMEEEK